MASTLTRHLDAALQQGMIISYATVTRNGVELCLQEANDDAGQSSSRAGSDVSSVAFDIPPFTTTERQDILYKALIVAGLGRFELRSISYSGCLSSPEIMKDFRRRAPVLEDLTLLSEEDVRAFYICAHVTHFPKLQILNIDCELSAPATTLENIFKVMRHAAVGIRSRLELSWTSATGSRDMSTLSPELRLLLAQSESDLDWADVPIQSA
ncbi:unnamed protein product [Peniophora sp. CBMAI 1063]|nr:unnamed protein product [Peniophora sp. CBMAI 1063]